MLFHISEVSEVSTKRLKLSHENSVENENNDREISQINNDAEKDIERNCNTPCDFEVCHSSDIQPNCNTPCQLTNCPDLLDDTPRKRMLKTVLKNTREQYKKKIKILQQKQRRSTKRIAKLKDILTSLKQKNLLNTEQLDVLKDLDILFTSNDKETCHSVS